MNDETSNRINGNVNGAPGANTEFSPSLKSLKNLKPAWPKGQSGNPKGRVSRQDDIKEVIAAWLAKDNRLEALLKRLAIVDPKTLLHYVYGRPPETMVHASVQLTEEEKQQRINQIFGIDR